MATLVRVATDATDYQHDGREYRVVDSLDNLNKDLSLIESYSLDVIGPIIKRLNRRRGRFHTFSDALFDKLNEIYDADVFTLNFPIYFELDKSIADTYFDETPAGAPIDPANDKPAKTKIQRNRLFRKYRLRNPQIPSPYTNFDDNAVDDDKNCVIESLISKYSTLTPKNAISKKSINKFFSNEPTIQTLIDFTTKYRINLVLLDAYLRRVYQSEEGTYTTKRSAYVALVYNNHVYPYTMKYQGKVNTELKPNENVYVDRQHAYKKASEVFNTVSRNLIPNFSFYAERKMYARSLSMRDASYDPTTNNHITYDMRKAFYTATMKISNPFEKIPVFSCACSITKFNGKIKDHVIYFLSRDVDLRHIGLTSNFIHGFNARYLLSKKYIKKSDITHMKEPKYVLSVHNLRKRIRSLDDEHFSFYNGILGQKYFKYPAIKVNVPTEDDMDLLNSFDDVEFNTYSNTEINDNLHKRSRLQSYRYVNTRSIYDWVISRTNQVMFEAIDRLKDHGANIVGITTDSITISPPMEIEDDMFSYTNKPESLFRYKEKDTKDFIIYKIYKHFIDPDEINNQISDELDTFSNYIKTYTGAPGTGKTYTVMTNHNYDYAMAISNACCRNITTDTVTAETIFSSLKLYDPDSIHQYFNRYIGKTVFVDEFSMIPTYIYGYFYIMVATKQTKFIIAGDPDQIPPIGEKALDIKLPFFKAMFSNNTHLMKDYRNDVDLIKIRDEIKNGIYNFPISEIDPVNIKHHLVLSHNYKNYLNQYIINSLGLTFTSTYKRLLPAGTQTADDLENEKNVKYLYNASKGLILIATATSKSSKIYKSTRYELITNVHHKSKKFTIQRLDNEELETFNISKLKYFDLGYAFTVHSTQGITISEPAMIHEYKLMKKIDNSIMYTACTRLKCIEHLNIIDRHEGFDYRAKYRPINHHVFSSDVETFNIDES